MAKYQLRIDTPDPIRSYLEALTGIGEITGVTDLTITVVIEQDTDDEYELANTVRDLTSELNSIIGYRSTDIPRPKKIAD